MMETAGASAPANFLLGGLKLIFPTKGIDKINFLSYNIARKKEVSPMG